MDPSVCSNPWNEVADLVIFWCANAALATYQPSFQPVCFGFRFGAEFLFMPHTIGLTLVWPTC